MSTEQQARALMMRHHHAIKNRQQSMLERSASEIGIDNQNKLLDDHSGPTSAGLSQNPRSL
jgi:hypothetical protein